MSHSGIHNRIHLDGIAGSTTELGPPLPDGGYSWIILISSIIIQLTVASVVSMYGIVLGRLSTANSNLTDVWKNEITLIPILLVGFATLSDPWMRIMINLASVPRLFGLIGICLLSIGILASGYLATGGVGAYLASVSAGAIIGIGGSLVLIQAESIIRKTFRNHLRLVLTLRNVSTSLGFILAPTFTYYILVQSSLQIGLMLITCFFIPTTICVLFLRYPPLKFMFTLLISDEDNELTPVENNSTSLYHEDESRKDGLFGEGSDSYKDPDEDQQLFQAAFRAPNPPNWKQHIQVMKSFSFWLGTVAFLSTKITSLFIWILLPSLTITNNPQTSFFQGFMVSISSGIGLLIITIASYWKPSSARWRSLTFGSFSWLGSFILIGLTTKLSFLSFIVCGFIAGISIGGVSLYLETILLDILGYQSAKKSHPALCTIAGIIVLLFSFIPSPIVSLQISAALQFMAGIYWISTPIFGIIKAR